jgi:hypothetical protein
MVNRPLVLERAIFVLVHLIVANRGAELSRLDPGSGLRVSGLL